MSTRSTIAMKTDEGYKAIYCHWDGYISYNGAVLYCFYQDADKVRQLIELGDVSSIDKNIGSKHDFDNPPSGECNFYGRDRGEEGTEARTHKTLKHLRDHEEGYIYVFIDGTWYMYFGSKRTLLADKLAREFNLGSGNATVEAVRHEAGL